MNDMSPYDFDQSDKGWRLLDGQGKFVEAAKTIESYIASNENLINSQNRVSMQTMYFHAGQEYAMAGPDYYGQAIKNFRKAYRKKVDWDLYVDGTIAFLNNDRNELQKAADDLRSLAKRDSRLSANAQLLHDYLAALSKGDSYATVYDNTRESS